MKLSELVKIDNRFEKSVNLLLDLDNPDRVNAYIPTRSSVNVLDDYLLNVMSKKSERATVLIGPYGKGKSLLILVLLSILKCEESKDIEKLIKRIDKVNPDVASKIKLIRKDGRPTLPIILNASSGTLSEAFSKALMQALKCAGMDNIAPDSYYSEAIKSIFRWKKEYPGTFKMFAKTSAVSKIGVDEFIARLSSMDRETLTAFHELYPSLTAGGDFNPLISDNVIDTYRSVTRILCTEYGYRGIHIVFDEFSKYIEGHSMETFASDMKTLQDMCELSNASTSEEIHLTAIAHKAIKAYGNRLPKAVLNAYRGVEGRIKEKNFIVSSQNNYELIADAIIKKPAFGNWIKNDKESASIIKESYSLPLFKCLFNEKDYRKIIGEGCYPLSPVSAMLLLTLCEKIAQNERTVFTYLTDKGIGLSGFIQKAKRTVYASASEIYDYFTSSFRDETDDVIHGEWLKADYSLDKTDNEIEKRIIKTLAIIKMLKKAEEFPASEKNLILASCLNKKDFSVAIASLIEKELIVFKNRTNSYEFKKTIGIDIDKVIQDTIATKFGTINLTQELNSVLADKYIIPKKHNQDHCITRYYSFTFLKSSSYLLLGNYSHLEKTRHSDGTIVLLTDLDCSEKKLIKKSKELSDGRLVLLLPTSEEGIEEKLKYLKAVRYLKDTPEFIENNSVLKRELDDVDSDTLKEIEKWISNNYFNNKYAITLDGKVSISNKGINRLISDLCDRVYHMTPIINNELINRNIISVQNLKARNTIINDLLTGCNYEKYTVGSGPADTIGRATLISASNDPGVKNAKKIIKKWVISCEGKKKSFKEIILALTLPPVGMRMGIIPIYLAECLSDLDDMPVIYAGNRELQLSSESLNNAMRIPDDYYLYVEKETAQKEEYLISLENIYSDFLNKCRDIDNKNRMARIACMMQAWYRALPQTSKTCTISNLKTKYASSLVAFRKLFMGIDINPREVLFDLIPRVIGEDDYRKVSIAVRDIKAAIDQHMQFVHSNVENIIRVTFEFGDADLRMSLKEWYSRLPSTSKESIFDGPSQAFIAAVKCIDTTDNLEICDVISRASIGAFLEDYQNDSFANLENVLSEIKDTIENKSRSNKKNSTRISVDDGSGVEHCFAYSYNPDQISSTGNFFKNALEETIDEYPVSNEERVGILMEMVKRYINDDIS